MRKTKQNGKDKTLYSARTDSQSILVSVTPFDKTCMTDDVRQQDFGFRFNADLDAAIKRAQNHLLRIQKPEGYWVGELMVDSTLVSDMVAFHHWHGKIDRQWERKAIHHIFS